MPRLPQAFTAFESGGLRSGTTTTTNNNNNNDNNNNNTNIHIINHMYTWFSRKYPTVKIQNPKSTTPLRNANNTNT